MASNFLSLVTDEKYHTVPIRSDLQKISKDYREKSPNEFPPENFWVDEVKRTNGVDTKKLLFSKQKPDSTNAEYKLLYTKANGPYTHSGGNHAILTAFLAAYNSHEDVILSPDDIWLMVCIAFATYVNDNSEKLRHLFVDHQDKKTLTVEDVGVSTPDWDGFLERMRLQIGNHVKNDISALLTNNFSTTTKVESLVSCLAIMTTFKKYFDYEYLMTMCGIRNIHFLGTLDDWKLLREKTSQLQSFTISQDDFSRYITGLLPILDQFIHTYQGKVDNHFWDTIFNLEHRGGGSGIRPGTYVNGWFIKLCYGRHKQHSCHMADIGLQSLVVPVKVNNEYTNESKMCYFAGGFHGIESCDGMHKPVMSLAIIEDTASITPLKK